LLEESEVFAADCRLHPADEDLSFELNPPLLPRRPRDLIRTNSSDSLLLPITGEMAVDNTSSLLAQCLQDAKRSSFDEGHLDLCSGGSEHLFPGCGKRQVLGEGAAFSLPSITSSNVSMNDLRSEAALSELDLYEPPEDDCYIYTYKVRRNHFN
jgi:hypothetical protein